MIMYNTEYIIHPPTDDAGKSSVVFPLAACWSSTLTVSTCIAEQSEQNTMKTAICTIFSECTVHTTTIKLSESGVLSLGAGLGATGSAVSAFSGAT